MTTTADLPFTSGCEDGAPGESLRQALCRAQAATSAVVTVPAGTYTLTAGALEFWPAHAVDLTIVGQGTVVIDAQHASRVLDLDGNLVGDVNVTLQNLTIKNGTGDGLGAGGVIAGSAAPSRPDTLTIVGSTFVGNDAGAARQPGGAVQMNGGSLVVQDSTFSGNSAVGTSGAAIAFLGVAGAPADTVQVTRTAFSGDTVTGDATTGVVGGAGLYVSSAGAAVTVTGSSFTGESATSTSPSGALGSAVLVEAGTLSVTGSSIADNRVVAAQAIAPGSVGGAVAIGGAVIGASVTSSRLTGNTTSTGSTTHEAIRGVVDARNNWWGCATPPSGSGCDTAPQAITTTPFARLALVASPTQALAGGSAALALSVVMSDASTVPPALVAALAGRPVVWGTDSGSVTGASTLGSAGTASGTAVVASSDVHATARVDQVTASATVTFVAPAAIAANPADATVAEGTSATLTATVTGTPTPTVQWQTATAAAPTTWTDVTDGTSTTLSYPVTRADEGRRFRLVAQNSAGPAATSGVATVHVTWGPVIGTQPVGTTVLAGDAASFTVAATGAPTPTVAWQAYVGGTWTTVGTGTTYTRTTTLADDGLRVRAVVTGAGSTASDEAVLHVHALPTLSGPTDQTVASGAVATFQVSTSGGNPASTYQWQVAAPGEATFTDVPGATSASLDVTATPALDGARYRVVTHTAVVSGPTDVTSSAATLTVLYGPVVDASPSDVVGLVGDDVTFTASAHGNPAPTVEWQTSSDGSSWTTVAGAGSTTYTRTLAAGDDGLQVRARFTGHGTAATSAAAVTLEAVPAFATPPADTTVDEGADATFTVVATGAPTPTLQWQRLDDGTWTDLAGETGTSLVVDSVTAALDGTRYRAVATSTRGVVESAAATLTVLYGPVVDASPSDVVGLVGDDVSFTASAHGNPAPTVEWQTSPDGSAWTTVAGAASTTYTRTLAAGDGGLQIRALFTGHGTAATTAATVTLEAVPAFATPPADTTVDAGASATFSVVATGAPAPTLQWQRLDDGTWTDLAGQTGSSLLVGPTTAGLDGTQYRAVATSTRGVVASAPATLTVLVGPTVTDPASVTTVPGRAATFTVAATGQPAPTLTWQTSTDGAAWTTLAGETGTSLTLTPTLADDGLLVRAVAHGALVAGPVEAASEPAVLTVIDLPTLESGPEPTVQATAGVPVTLAWDVLSSGGTATWESSTDGGTTWGPLPAGATTRPAGAVATLAAFAVSYTAPAATLTTYTATLTPALADDGLQLRLTVTNSGGATTFDPVTLAVTAAEDGDGGESGSGGSGSGSGSGSDSGSGSGSGSTGSGSGSESGSGSSGAGSSTGSGNGVLGSTGWDVWPVVGLALLLVALGSAFVTAVRRRPSAE